VLEAIFQTANKLLRTDVDKLNFVRDLAVLSTKRSLNKDFIKSLTEKYMATIDYKNTFIYEESKEEIAERMLAEGMSLSQVAKFTGLPMTKIKELDKKMKAKNTKK